MSQTVPVKVPSDDELLAGTQAVRLRLIDDLTSQGDKMPSDPKDRIALLQTLDGVDRQVLVKKKIKAEEKTADAAQKAAAAVVTAVFQRLGNGDPFAVEGRTGAPPREPGNLIEDVEIVPGELEMGLSLADYNDLGVKEPKDRKG